MSTFVLGRASGQADSPNGAKNRFKSTRTMCDVALESVPGTAGMAVLLERPDIAHERRNLARHCPLMRPIAQTAGGGSAQSIEPWGDTHPTQV